MRCFFFKSRCDHRIKSGQLQHQGFLAGIGSREHLACLRIFAFLTVAFQNGFDPHNGVQDVRPCIAFKGSETLNVKHIILGSLI